jgi:orotate phosphoribosyltransferase
MKDSEKTLPKRIGLFMNNPDIFRLETRYIPTLNRTAPYFSKTPRVLTAELLNEFSYPFLSSIKNLLTIQSIDLNRLYLCGIASGGIPLATALTLNLHEPGVPGPKLAIIDPHTRRVRDYEPAPDTATVLVDNAIHTGRTLKAARELIESAGGRIDLVCKIFDHMTKLNNGKPLVKIFSHIAGCEVLSSVSICELLMYMDDSSAKEEIVHYLSVWGDESAREILSRLDRKEDTTALAVEPEHSIQRLKTEPVPKLRHH